MAKKVHTQQESEVKEDKTAMFDTFFTPEIANRCMNKQPEQDEKDAIERLYSKVFHVQMPKTCNNCLSDAYFELYNIWKKDKQHFYDLYSCEYRLKAGVLLEIFSKSTKFATNKNLTNALAEEHLRDNRNKIKLFSVLPPDWETRLL